MGLTGRVLLTYLALAVISVGTFAVRYGWTLQDRRVVEFQNTQQRHALLVASSLAPVMARYVHGNLPPDDLDLLVDQLGVGIDSRLTLLDARGDVIHDTQFAPERIGNQWQRVEVQTALAQQTQYDIRADTITGAERLYVAAPVQMEGEVLGVLQLSLPTDTMWASIREAWESLWMTALVALAVATFAGVLLKQIVLHPIHNLRRVVFGLAAGDLNSRLPVVGRGDLADVTHALDVMSTRMRGLLQQQKDFIANASHQLRTPLTTIKLRVEALAGGARNDEVVAGQFLADIESEVDRLSHLVDELLLLSRVEAGIESVKMEQVNLASVLGQAVTAFHPRAEAAGVAITLNAPENVAAVRASAPHIRQVMDNLLDNALKHTPSGGLVTVSCRRSDGMIAVAVTDTGHGITTQDLPRVFDRFYRGRSRTRMAGSGLGLTIVRSIVEVHGGAVEVVSQEGKGTSVRFTLPVNDRPAPTRIPA